MRRSLRRRTATVLGLVLLAGSAAAAGCSGSSGDGTPTPTTHGDAASEAPRTPDEGASATPDDGQISLVLQRDLAGRLATSAEFLGMTPSGPRRFLTPQEMAMSDPDPGAQQTYQRQKLHGVVSEHLTSPRSTDAISTVLRFEQPSGAEQDLASATEVPSADQVKVFDVPGIPSAVGTDVLLDGNLVGRNVWFTTGPYEYVIGFQPDPTAAKTFSRQQLAAAAKAWYARVAAL
jgi:hypothetical protein